MVAMTMAAFADILKRLRTEAGLTQQELAQRSGLGLTTIRQFEYGTREPAYSTLKKVAKGLGVSLSAFDDEATSDAPSSEPAPGDEASPPPATAKRGRRRKTTDDAGDGAAE